MVNKKGDIDMDIFETAKQLGTMLANSEQMTRLKNAEANLEGDSTANELMNKYKELQVKVVRATKARAEKQEIEALREELMAHQAALNENAVTKEFLESKTEFENFTKTINQVITYAMTGEEGCSSSNCGSCSGCH